VPYREAVQGWHDFYLLAGTAAATLVGLLFVGLSLHLSLIVARPDVRALARITLANFGLTLFLSLFMLIRQAPAALGTELVVGGVITASTIVPHLVSTVRTPRRTLTTRHLVLRFGLSSVACCGVIVAGILFQVLRATTGLSWLWILTISLLAISLRNTWDLLVEVGIARGREPVPASEPADTG
jgi:hypothetical protein